MVSEEEDSDDSASIGPTLRDPECGATVAKPIVVVVPLKRATKSRDSLPRNVRLCIWKGLLSAPGVLRVSFVSAGTA